jgi:hypothetical protein
VGGGKGGQKIEENRGKSGVYVPSLQGMEGYIPSIHLQGGGTNS